MVLVDGRVFPLFAALILLVAGVCLAAAAVDQAVRRVLTLKERLGLFDDPFRRIDPKREKARVRTPATLALAPLTTGAMAAVDASAPPAIRASALRTPRR